MRHVGIRIQEAERRLQRRRDSLAPLAAAAVGGKDRLASLRDRDVERCEKTVLAAVEELIEGAPRYPRVRHNVRNRNPAGSAFAHELAHRRHQPRALDLSHRRAITLATRRPPHLVGLGGFGRRPPGPRGAKRAAASCGAVATG
jgi:hypothetical protein